MRVNKIAMMSCVMLCPTLKTTLIVVADDHFPLLTFCSSPLFFLLSLVTRKQEATSPAQLYQYVSSLFPCKLPCWAPLTHATHGTGISTYMCLTFTVNVGKYTIHRCYGSGLPVYLHKPDQLDIRFQPVHWTWRTIRAFIRIKPRQKTDLPVLSSKNWTMKFFHWEINIEAAIDYLHQLNWGDIPFGKLILNIAQGRKCQISGDVLRPHSPRKKNPRPLLSRSVTRSALCPSYGSGESILRQGAFHHSGGGDGQKNTCVTISSFSFVIFPTSLQLNKG